MRPTVEFQKYAHIMPAPRNSGFIWELKITETEKWWRGVVIQGYRSNSKSHLIKFAKSLKAKPGNF